MQWNRKFLALGLSILALPAVAVAKLCGDNISGHDIPCDCGDVVITDTVLTDDDPVTQAICEDDGLMVRADSLQKSLRLDLNGTTLRGSKTGTGITIMYGGQKGARIFSSGGPATISGFRDAIGGHGTRSLNILTDVNIIGPERDGVRITNGRRYRISKVTVRDAGRNGFWLSGERYQLRRTKSLNSKNIGYFIMGEHGTLGTPGNGITASGSGDAGFNLMGSGHRLIDCLAEASGKNGIVFTASQTLIHGCKAIGNMKDGISGNGGTVRIARNRADENEASGIEIHGHNLSDLGGNRGELNRLGGNSQPSVQCQIGSRPCQ